MKERPILFSGAMVRAILDGRKTQTRRVITKWNGPDFPSGNGADQRGYCTVEDHTISRKPWTEDLIKKLVACQYGQPGDRLWVREAWRTVAEADTLPPRNLNAAHRIWFEANAPHQPGFGKYRPPMFMPRLVSRITLEITDVRAERLQEISEEDAKHEGAEPIGSATAGQYQTGFRVLWDFINATRDYGWDVNPWVWVIEFKRTAP